jgi:hypothetical protein
MNKDIYCKSGPLPKGKTYGSMKECAARKQVGYWGVNKIDNAVLKSANVPKGISLDKARMLKIKFDTRLKKLNTDLKFSEDKYNRNPDKHSKEKEKIKTFKEEIKKTEKELEKATKDYQQAFKLKEEKVSLKRGKDSKYKIDKPKEEPKEKSDLPDRINKTLEDSKKIKDVAKKIKAMKEPKLPKVKEPKIKLNYTQEEAIKFYKGGYDSLENWKYMTSQEKKYVCSHYFELKKMGYDIPDYIEKYHKKYCHPTKPISKVKEEPKVIMSKEKSDLPDRINKTLEDSKKIKDVAKKIKAMKEPKLPKAMKEPKVKEEKKISKLDITQEEIEELMKMGITIKEIEKLLNNKSKKGRNA